MRTKRNSSSASTSPNHHQSSGRARPNFSVRARSSDDLVLGTSQSGKRRARRLDEGEDRGIDSEGGSSSRVESLALGLIRKRRGGGGVVRRISQRSSTTTNSPSSSDMMGLDFNCEILISGLNRVNLNGDKVLDSLLAFLSEKSSRNTPVIFSSSTLLPGNRVKVTVATEEMKRSLISLNGIRFQREKLLIRVLESATSAIGNNNPTVIAEKLSALLPLAFDPAQGLLMLDNMASTFPDGGINLNNRRNAVAVFESIGKQPWSKNITALSIGSCNLESLRYFSGLWEDNLPSLIRLNLSDNKLKSFGDVFPSVSHRDASSIKSPEHQLIHLILKGNPIHKNYAGDTEKLKAYYCEIMKKCPAIQIIDDQAFSPEEKVALCQQFSSTTTANASSNKLVPSFVYEPPVTLGAFFDQETTRTAVFDFINKYFTCYDQQRMNLVDAYHESASLFSISIAALPNIGDISPNLKRMDLSHRSKISPLGLKEWNTRYPDFGKFQVRRLRASLTEMEPYKEFIKEGAVYQGSKDIVKCLAQFPATKHVETTFVVDSFQFQSPNASSHPPTLFLYINGEFKETNSSGAGGKEVETIRSFGRNFVLIPSTNPNWPISIVNDTLILYNFCNPRRKTMTYSATPQEINSLTGNEHGPEIIRFSEATALNVETAKKCLSENQWDELVAFKAFTVLNESKKFRDDSFLRPT